MNGKDLFDNDAFVKQLTKSVQVGIFRRCVHVQFQLGSYVILQSTRRKVLKFNQ